VIAALFAACAASPATSGFWEAAARGELVVQCCLSCGGDQHPPRGTCAACGASRLDFRASSGLGMVYSYTVVERALIPELREVVPYVLGLVDLIDGPRMMALLRVDPDEVRIGMTVRVSFEQITAESALPVFIAGSTP
jgi:uncharacterized OB-fold protein